jgi:hypothetical protein
VTEAIWLASIVAIPATLAALPGLIVSLKSLRKTKQVYRLADGRMTRLESELAAAINEIKTLRGMLASASGGRRRPLGGEGHEG